MYSIRYKTTAEFFSQVDLDLFPLTGHYKKYSDCYQDDNWIQYTAYFQDNKMVFVIAERLLEIDKNIGHILLVEVNKNHRLHGIGKECLLDFIKQKKGWTLYSVPQSIDFYKSLGFISSDDEGELKILNN